MCVETWRHWKEYDRLLQQVSEHDEEKLKQAMELAFERQNPISAEVAARAYNRIAGFKHPSRSPDIVQKEEMLQTVYDNKKMIQEMVFQSMYWSYRSSRRITKQMFVWMIMDSDDWTDRAIAIISEYCRNKLMPLIPTGDDDRVWPEHLGRHPGGLQKSIPHRGIQPDPQDWPCEYELEERAIIEAANSRDLIVIFFDDVCFPKLQFHSGDVVETMQSKIVIPFRMSRGLTDCLEEMHADGRSELLVRYHERMKGVIIVPARIFKACMQAASQNVFPKKCYDGYRREGVSNYIVTVKELENYVVYVVKKWSNMFNIMNEVGEQFDWAYMRSISPELFESYAQRYRLFNKAGVQRNLSVIGVESVKLLGSSDLWYQKGIEKLTLMTRGSSSQGARANIPDDAKVLPQEIDQVVMVKNIYNVKEEMKQYLHLRIGLENAVRHEHIQDEHEQMMRTLNARVEYKIRMEDRSMNNINKWHTYQSRMWFEQLEAGRQQSFREAAIHAAAEQFNKIQPEIREAFTWAYQCIMRQDLANSITEQGGRTNRAIVEKLAYDAMVWKAMNDKELDQIKNELIQGRMKLAEMKKELAFKEVELTNAEANNTNASRAVRERALPNEHARRVDEAVKKAGKDQILDNEYEEIEVKVDMAKSVNARDKRNNRDQQTKESAKVTLAWRELVDQVTIFQKRIEGLQFWCDSKEAGKTNFEGLNRREREKLIECVRTVDADADDVAAMVGETSRDIQTRICRMASTDLHTPAGQKSWACILLDEMLHSIKDHGIKRLAARRRRAANDPEQAELVQPHWWDRIQHPREELPARHPRHYEPRSDSDDDDLAIYRQWDQSAEWKYIHMHRMLQSWEMLKKHTEKIAEPGEAINVDTVHAKMKEFLHQEIFNTETAEAIITWLDNVRQCPRFKEMWEGPLVKSHYRRMRDAIQNLIPLMRKANANERQEFPGTKEFGDQLVTTKGVRIMRVIGEGEEPHADVPDSESEPQKRSQNPCKAHYFGNCLLGAQMRVFA